MKTSFLLIACALTTACDTKAAGMQTSNAAPNRGSAQSNSNRAAASFYFSVDLGTGQAGSFQEASGLDNEVLRPGHPEASRSEPNARKMPRARGYQKLVLKRGILTNGSDLWEWSKQVDGSLIAKAIKTRTLTIDLSNSVGTPIVTWTLTGAWPVRVSRSDVQFDDGQVAVESLEIDYATITAKKR